MTRIKILLVMACCTLQLHLASAQSAEMQQLLLNIEKLAQFKQILSNMKKGYETISQGYQKIKDISEGNFNLHQTFLDGLLAVNPELRKYKRVADITACQGQLLKEYKAAFGRFKNGGRFSPQEIDYLSDIYGNLFDRSLRDLDELAMVMTSNRLRMSDDERIEAIDRLYADMQTKLSFLRRFNKQVSALDHYRERLQTDASVLRKLSGQ